MRHLGNVCDIHGYAIEPVDVLTGGSPCQDLSVAGVRKGLKHEDLDDEETTRSGLFMEQIRIAKEMRERDRLSGRSGVDVRCRYFVWENVCGAYSSNGGRDFQTVLTEIIRVAEPTAPAVPLPDGGWPKYGCYYSEMGNWSLAYRTVDAQFFGTPQRRKRIALLCDFNGLTAPEILFDPQLRGKTEREESDEALGSDGREGAREVHAVSESLRGDSVQSGEAGERTASRPEGDAGEASGVISFQERAGKPGGGKGLLIQAEHVGALSTQNVQMVPDKNRATVAAVDCRNFTENQDINGTLQAKKEGTSLNYNNVVRVAGFSFGQSSKARSLGYEEELSPTLRGGEGGNQKPVALVVIGKDENADA